MIWSRHPFFRKEMLQKFASFLNLAKKCKIIAVCGMERVLNISKQNNALHSFCANLQEEQLCMSKQKLQFFFMQQPFSRTYSNAFICQAFCIFGQNSELHFILRNIQKEHSAAVYFYCNILCSSPLQGPKAMHLHEKLHAYLVRIVHCTSFCAFLLGLHVPKAI